MSQVCFSLSVFSFLPVDSLHWSQAASVAILPSALLVERFSLGAWWVFPIQRVLENDFAVVTGTGTARDFIRLLTVELDSAPSQYRVGLPRFESGCVLVFQGGVFGCSSRMNGKPSSPVLRGLGASNGARLLDQVAESACSTWIVSALVEQPKTC